MKDKEVIDVNFVKNILLKKYISRLIFGLFIMVNAIINVMIVESSLLHFDL